LHATAKGHSAESTSLRHVLSACRIHILEKRLKRHEEQALHKYYELDHKLRSDPRLQALLTL